MISHWLFVDYWTACLLLWLFMAEYRVCLCQRFLKAKLLKAFLAPPIFIVHNIVRITTPCSKIANNPKLPLLFPGTSLTWFFLWLFLLLRDESQAASTLYFRVQCIPPAQAGCQGKSQIYYLMTRINGRHTLPSAWSCKILEPLEHLSAALEHLSAASHLTTPGQETCWGSQWSGELLCQG